MAVDPTCNRLAGWPTPATTKCLYAAGVTGMVSEIQTNADFTRGDAFLVLAVSKSGVWLHVTGWVVAAVKTAAGSSERLARWHGTGGLTDFRISAGPRNRLEIIF